MQRTAVITGIAALFIAAVDATAVGPALPTMVAELSAGGAGGGSAWLLSGFLLAQVLATPPAGWAADRFGERLLLVAGAGLFGAASVIVATAPSLPVAIGGRFVHGVAAAMLIVGAYTALAAQYGRARRAAAQGVLSAVWGVSAVLGPVVGTLLMGTVGWRFIFWVNLVPVAAIIVTNTVRRPSGDAGNTRAPFRPLEYAVVGLLSVSVLCAVEGPGFLAHPAARVVLVVTAAGCALWLRGNVGTLVPRRLLRATPEGGAAAVTLLGCAAMYGTVALLPFVLTARDASTALIGATIGAAAIGWVAGSAATSPLLGRFGLRTVYLLSGAGYLLGCIACGFAVILPVGGLAVGVATGLCTAAAMVTIQDSVPESELGVATSAAQLVRHLGSAVGINVALALSYGHLASRPIAGFVLLGVSAAAGAVAAAYGVSRADDVAVGVAVDSPALGTRV